jgi:MoxR-like ATPase
MAEAIDIRELNIRIEQQSQFVTNLVMGMNKVIVGQKHLVDCLLIGLLSDGHILLEGVPGLAKTLAIKTLSQLISSDYSRIQFTPDLLPADVVGTQIYSQKDEAFHVKRGPVFANFVLADEINRAPAKVQSALLEAMQEHQVTIGDETFKLPSPFLVMATQNPIEQEGTYQLPEAQVDRFLLKVIIDYPTLEEEKLIIRENIQGGLPEVTPVTSAEEILKARKIVNEVYLDEKIEQYIADIVFASRYPERYGLVDEVDGIHQVCIVLIHQGFIFGKLHEIGSLEEFLQFIYHLLVACFAQTFDDFGTGHLHGIESETAHDIFSQRIGKLGVVSLLCFLILNVLLLDDVDLIQRLFMSRNTFYDADTGDNWLIILQSVAQIKPCATED